MKFLIDVADCCGKNKYGRVIDALLKGDVACDIQEIEVKRGRLVAASGRSPSEPEGWLLDTIPHCRQRGLRDIFRVAELTIFAFLLGFFPRLRLRLFRDALAWRVTRAIELLPVARRKTVIELAKVSTDPARKALFLQWLAEREFRVGGSCREHAEADVAPEVEIEPGDVLILAGPTWRYDVAALSAIKLRHHIRILSFIYDVLPLEYPSIVTPEQFDRFQQFLLDIAKVADVIAVPHKDTARKIQQFLGTSHPRAAEICVLSLQKAGLARNPHFSQRLSAMNLEGQDFLLCASPLKARKHVLWLFNLCATLSDQEIQFPRLVFSGSASDKGILEILQRDPRWKRVAVFLEDPSDGELSWLLLHARLCLNPSFEGGCGLAVIDALNHGCPYIAADAAALMEMGQSRIEHLGRAENLWAQAIKRELKVRNRKPVPACVEPDLLDQVADLMLLPDVSSVSKRSNVS